jgi:hypothetical protein
MTGSTFRQLYRGGGGPTRPTALFVAVGGRRPGSAILFFRRMGVRRGSAAPRKPGKWGQGPNPYPAAIPPYNPPAPLAALAGGSHQCRLGLPLANSSPSKMADWRNAEKTWVCEDRCSSSLAKTSCHNSSETPRKQDVRQKSAKSFRYPHAICPAGPVYKFIKVLQP